MLTTAFTACDKDDDSNPTGLAGTWKKSKIAITKMENKDVNYELTGEMVDDWTLVFNADGTTKFGTFTLHWELIDNNTKLIVKYPLSDVFETKADTTNVSIENNMLIMTEANHQYWNLDEDSEDGDFSFTKFDEKFKTNIKGEKLIDVSSKEFFTRQ